MNNYADETINKGSTGWWGRTDCEDRSKMAIDRFPSFFEDPAHVTKVELVLQIVKDFFKVNKAIYVNRRVGTSKSGPFTVIKVNDPIFPNTMKSKDKNDFYYEPLKQLGIKIVINRATCSYLYHNY